MNGTEDEHKKKGTRNVEEVARLVYAFVRSAGDMVAELNGENDEAKLLRIRTKKNELVVVPGESITNPPREDIMLTIGIDAKFLLVVIHDTPPA